MKHLQKILLALLVWGIAATGNSFAQLPRECRMQLSPHQTNALPLNEYCLQNLTTSLCGRYVVCAHCCLHSV